MIIKTKNIKQRKTKQKGVTLIELMVAMVISMFVLLAVITVYVTTKRTYRYQETIIQLQENARYAFSTLGSDLREAGFSGCNPTVNNLLDPAGTGFNAYNPQAGIEGWEYTATDTSPGNNIAQFTSSTTFGADTDWTGTGAVNLNTLLTGTVVQGTDMLAITSARPREDLIPNSAPATSASITVNNAHNISKGAILIVGDCAKGDMFQNNTQGTGTAAVALTRPAAGSPGNITPANWIQPITSDMRIQVVRSLFYYIGVNPEGEPALYRADFSLGTAAVIPDEIAPGVENMQILYGEDLTDDDNFMPDQYVTADQITNPDNVVTVRISLLVRTPDNLNRTAIAAPNPFQMLTNTLGTTTRIQYTTADQRARRVFTSTIFLRNKGLYRERIGV